MIFSGIRTATKKRRIVVGHRIPSFRLVSNRKEVVSSKEFAGKTTVILLLRGFF